MMIPSAHRVLTGDRIKDPKRVYGDNHQAPSTRMGNVAGYRQAFADAQDYQQFWVKYNREGAECAKKKGESGDADTKKSKEKDKEKSNKDSGPPTPPKRDLKLETLAEVMKGHIRVHMHC